jgi:hydroxyacylglutathione hydrolase
VVEVYGHGGDAAWFAPDDDVAGRAEVVLGALRLAVVPAPGHTPGSVVYVWRGRAFTGDTLFWAGCGNCRHGGDPAALARSLTGPVAALDGALEVHPGHDYAELNLPFALALEPANARAARRLEAVRAAHASGQEPEPSTLEEERAVNPFLRVDVPSVRDAIRVRTPEVADDPQARVVALRRIRDAW